MPWLIGKAGHEPYFTNDPPKSGDQMLDPPKIGQKSDRPPPSHFLGVFLSMSPSPPLDWKSCLDPN